jgi:molecular chaperone Hsp33
MKDFIYTGRIENYHIGFTFAVTTEAASKSVVMHNCDPVSAHVYCRAFTAALMAAQSLKEHEKYNFVWKYTGELKSIVVDVNADNGFRGFISPVDLANRVEESDDLHGDECRMDVVRSIGGKIITASSTESILQDVANDLCFFFSYSDQIETDMCVMVGFNPEVNNPVNLCQGLMLQALPDCNFDVLERIRKRLAEQPARDLLARHKESDNYFEDVLNHLFEGEEEAPSFQFENRPTPYVDCTCSDEKVEFVASSLPQEDRDEMMEKNEDLRMHCEFCNKTFVKTPAECEAIWESDSEENA